MKRLIAALPLLLVLTAAQAAQPAAPQPFSEAQKAEIQELVRQVLRDHPEIVLDAIETLEAKEAEKKQTTERETLTKRHDDIERDPTDIVAGNPAGDVTLVEFFDYRCGYCKVMIDRLDEVVKGDGKVRLVLKEFPILGPNSTLASRAALASIPQGKYLAFHDLMMARKGDINEASIMAMAAEAGLDVDKLKEEMKKPEIDQKLARNKELAKALQLDGTPGFVIGKQIIRGALDKDELKKAVGAARSS
jgi:protein-disulfide isomerase